MWALSFWRLPSQCGNQMAKKQISLLGNLLFLWHLFTMINSILGEKVVKLADVCWMIGLCGQII